MDIALSAAAPRRATGPAASLRPHAETLAMVGASTLVGLLVAPRWGTATVDLLYLPAVLAAAGFFGLGPGLFAAIASALAYNYFFTAPLHSFRIASADDIFTVSLLFLVALVTSQLAARMRSAVRAARASAARDSTIAGLARKLLSCTDSAQIADVACQELASLFDCHAIVLAAGDEQPLAAFPAHGTLTPSDQAMAAWAIAAGEPAGRGVSPVATSEWAFFPIRSGEAVLGAIGLARSDGSNPAPADRRALLDNLLDQVALALERSRLEDEARLARNQRERNRLRSALLATIGQDVEPRLSALGGAVSALRREGLADRATLSAMTGEIAQLRRYLANLLDLGPESEPRPLRLGTVDIDLLNRAVTRGGERVHLTPKEYAVLAELAKYPGRVLEHAHLLTVGWGPAHDRQLDYLRVAVRGLRVKLEEDPAHPALILNEPGVGYRLAADPA